LISAAHVALDELIERLVGGDDAPEAVGHEDGLDHRVEDRAQTILFGAQGVEAIDELIGHAVERTSDRAELVVAVAARAGREIARSERVGGARELARGLDEHPTEHEREQDRDEHRHQPAEHEQLSDRRVHTIGERGRAHDLDHELAVTGERDVLAAHAPRGRSALEEGLVRFAVHDVARRVVQLVSVEPGVADHPIAAQDRDTRASLRAHEIGDAIGRQACAELGLDRRDRALHGLLRELGDAVLDQRIFEQKERQDQRADRGDDRTDEAPTQSPLGSGAREAHEARAIAGRTRGGGGGVGRGAHGRKLDRGTELATHARERGNERATGR
jgi:hypothetical protein